MNLSKEDMFCEKKQLAAGAQTTDILDFHNHGDDIQHKLFLIMHVEKSAANAKLTVEWQTSDSEDFTTGNATLSSTELSAAVLVAGTYPIKNVPMPRGLKRYNRLKLTGATDGSGAATYPIVTAALIDGRDDGTPFVG